MSDFYVFPVSRYKAPKSPKKQKNMQNLCANLIFHTIVLKMKIVSLIDSNRKAEEENYISGGNEIEYY
jgi:hypothetical protein